MSQQTIIDPQKFALDQRALKGRLKLSEMDRLQDQLAENEGFLEYQLSGWWGDRRQVCLSLQVDGLLQLVCQRCLGRLSFELSVDAQLEMLPEGAELTQDELEDDSKDYLPLERTLDVAALIEDEVILALPVAARHDVCELQGRAEAGEQPSPFAALASIKTLSS